MRWRFRLYREPSRVFCVKQPVLPLLLPRPAGKKRILPLYQGEERDEQGLRQGRRRCGYGRGAGNYAGICAGASQPRCKPCGKPGSRRFNNDHDDHDQRDSGSVTACVTCGRYDDYDRRHHDNGRWRRRIVGLVGIDRFGRPARTFRDGRRTAHDCRYVRYDAAPVALQCVRSGGGAKASTPLLLPPAIKKSYCGYTFE